MSKKLIIILALIIIALPLIWLTAKNAIIKEPVKEGPLPAKEFYTRKDLEYIKTEPGKVNIFYMWMKGCPVCSDLDSWFEKIKDGYNIEIYKFDIARESGLFIDVLEAYQVPAEKRGFVPFVFIGDKYFIGFNQSIGKEMESAIEECLTAENCPNPYDKL